MKFLGILFFIYFIMGYMAKMAIFGKNFAVAGRPNPTYATPFIEQLLPYLLLAIILGLPVYGYFRAKRQGEFMRLTPFLWALFPPLFFVSGFVLGFLYK